jgi:hypothetical protein
LLFAKTAILIEWVRIFSPYRTHTFFFWASYLMALLNTLLYVSSIISSAITCISHESLWYPWVPGKCINRKALGLFTAFFNVIMDLVILLLPQRIIWTLQMTKARKIGISIVFSVGVLATLCAAGRVAATFDLSYEGDATYTVSPVLMWALPEMTCVLLVFSLPTLPQTFAQQGPLYKIVSFMRSWTLISTQQSDNSSGFRKLKAGWFTTARGKPAAQVYDMIDEDGQATSLARLRLIKNEPRKGDVQSLQDLSPPSPQQTVAHETSRSGIMKS